MRTSCCWVLAVLFLLFPTGCEKIDPALDTKDDTIVEGTGPVVTVDLDLSSFSKIESLAIADFYISIGSPQSVTLNAQQNIIDVMTYSVKDETFKAGIQENISIRNQEEIRFDISVDSISSIKMGGIGSFTLSGDDQNMLEIILAGVGDVHAYGMRADICTIESLGFGNCEVHVLNELTVTISGLGNVYYRGDPDISSTITGLGQLIDAN